MARHCAPQMLVCLLFIFARQRGQISAWRTDLDKVATTLNSDEVDAEDLGNFEKTINTVETDAEDLGNFDKTSNTVETDTEELGNFNKTFNTVEAPAKEEFQCPSACQECCHAGGPLGRFFKCILKETNTMRHNPRDVGIHTDMQRNRALAALKFKVEKEGYTCEEPDRRGTSKHQFKIQCRYDVTQSPPETQCSEKTYCCCRSSPDANPIDGVCFGDQSTSPSLEHAYGDNAQVTSAAVTQWLAGDKTGCPGDWVESCTSWEFEKGEGQELLLNVLHMPPGCLRTCSCSSGCGGMNVKGDKRPWAV